MGDTSTALFVVIPMTIILILIVATILFFRRKSEKDKDF
ncbi:LPXTG cell wall anchor domain-containing protein [Rossellomorea aquimaris]|nr:LPXTG cell wall anchor domain-containing protein [Rossellomorea aquimaris]